MTTRLPHQPLTVFCGKGGVGKTTIALAFGLWHARRGRRVVVVTSHPLRELAASVSLHGLKESQPEAAARLFVVHVDPRETLTAKVRQQIPSKLLANAVISSRLYQSLVEVAPGLKEIAFLARLRELVDTRQDEGRTEAFDALVWDAPATGHLLQTLKASRNFDTYMSGPFALLGRDLADFLSDPEKFRIVPVTTAEEMAVEETVELCARLSIDFGTVPHSVICNLTSPLLARGEPELERMRHELSALVEPHAFDFIFDRLRVERELYRKLACSVKSPLCVVERKTGWRSDLELLSAVSDELGGPLGDPR